MNIKTKPIKMNQAKTQELIDLLSMAQSKDQQFAENSKRDQNPQIEKMRTEAIARCRAYQDVIEWLQGFPATLRIRAGL